MNNARKGARAEHKSIRLLEAGGYRCIRSAASKGTFDIVAVGPADVLLIQCKVNRWPSPAEMDAIANFATPSGVRRIVHRWRPRQAAPDVRGIVNP
jgi:Holliday junction resolvase